MMAKYLTILLGFILLVSGNGMTSGFLLNKNINSSELRFEENRGQIPDPANEVLFVMKDQGITLYFHKQGVYFQWHYFEDPFEFITGISEATGLPVKPNATDRPGPGRQVTFQVASQWEGSNEHVEVIPENPLPGYNNYYYPHCQEGITGVKSYQRLVYRNLYPCVDVIYHVNGGVLKYDIVLRPGSDFTKLKYRYSGAKPTKVGKNLRIEMPIGFIEEHEPLSWGTDGRPVTVEYQLAYQGVSFCSNGNSLEVIDPVITWGSYYGNSGEDKGFGTAFDNSGNVYLAGYTGSSAGIASGGHQNTFGGSNLDGFLVKFNSAGTREWGTYYGGSGSDFAKSVDVNSSGEIYLVGFTSSTNAIATAGSYQASNGGLLDGFIAKFDPAGIRLWATYYGGTDEDAIESVTVASDGGVFVGGDTKSTATIATTGGHQEIFAGGTNDGFIAKFDGSGLPQWASYYGGTGNDYGTNVAVDPNGNAYLGGYTASTSDIASGGHQNTFGGGGFDAFVAQFNASGVRQWASYYGGSGDDIGLEVATDPFGNVFIAGSTVSALGIASGGHQNVFGGFVDAFLVKFNSSGNRQWATYYGGTGEDGGLALCTDTSGNSYLGGETASATSIASGGVQNTIGGGTYDAFIVKLSPSGNRLWGSYYGGTDEDSGEGVAVDLSGNAYIAGTTVSASSIAAGGHQITFGGGSNDAFLVKIQDVQIYYVSTTGNDSNDGAILTPFRTIQHALNTAATGEIIKVAGGNYNEGLITQSQVTLMGGYADNFTEANRNIFTNQTKVTAVSTIILNDAFGCTIEGFVFDGNNTAEVGLNITSSSIIRNNIVLRVKSSPGQGINISGAATVVNNNFHDNITGGIIFGGSSASSIFKNNILTNNSFGLNNSSAAGIHRYTCVFGNSFNYTGNFNTPGTGDINLNPQFLNSASDDFRLAASSPAIDAGDPADPVGNETCSTRINMGAYGGTNLASCALAGEPSQASSISFSSFGTTSLTVNFTNGGGSSRLLVARAGSAVNSDPVDGVSYSSNNSFGIGSQIGSGNYVVGSGSGPITVTGLSAGTTYHFRVYEFNGSGGNENYNVNAASGNPNNSITIPPAPIAGATTSIGQTSFTANWATSTGSTSYFLDVSTDAFSTFVTGYNNLAVGNVTNYAVTNNLAAGTNYSYRVRASNSAGISANSNSINLTTLSTPLAPEPSAQPSNMTFTNQQSTSFTINFIAAAGNPDGYIAFMKEGSSPSFVPVDGSTYLFNEEPDPSGDPGTFTVLNDVFTSFGIESVTPGATLFFDIYSYNGSGSGINYLSSSPLEGSFTTSLLPNEPSTQANNLIITQPFSSTLQVSWTNGDGSSRLVVAKQGGVVDQAPGDGVTYFASSSFSSGDDLGGGNYVVYNGTGNSVSVTDIQSSVSYQFFVFEYNGAAGSENYNISTSTNNPKSFATSGDPTPPVVGVDSTPGVVSPGTAVDVTAQFSDLESGVASVNMDYKSASSSGGFTSLPMTNTTGDTWTAQIPSSALGELGIEYQMTAFNGVGSDITTNSKFVKVIYTEGLTIPILKFGSSVADYRIVSIPLDLTDKKMSSVFGKVLGPYDGIGWRMYRYENGKTGELSANSAIESGLGYWLIVRENSGNPILSGEGTTVLNLPKTIELKGDWNQIGNPYNFNLLWSDVVAANPGLPGLTTYNGDFAGSSTILPKFSGGFVKLPSGQTMTLYFPITKNPSAGRKQETLELKNSLDLPNWQVSLTLKHGDRINSLGGFGMNENASEGFDVLDQFTLPRFFDQFLEVNHTKRDGRDHFATDVVPTSQNQIWEFSVASTGKDALMTFSWDNSYFGNNNRELYWMDVGTGMSFDMRATTNFAFDKNISGPFKIIYGDKSFIEENTMVDRLILHGAYPIPSDEEVTISFSLPGSDITVTSVEVHDLLGRQIWMIENLFSPGYNEVKWIRNGAAPGIYLARINAGNVSRQTRLMVR